MAKRDKHHRKTAKRRTRLRRRIATAYAWKPAQAADDTGLWVIVMAKCRACRERPRDPNEPWKPFSWSHIYGNCCEHLADPGHRAVVVDIPWVGGEMALRWRGYVTQNTTLENSVFRLEPS